MRIILSFIGMAFALLGMVLTVTGIAVTIMALTAPVRSWDSVGRLWFSWHPSSIQQAESVISRYIDPCGLIVALDCAPFLWHPVISTVLTWYASPVFLMAGIVLLGIGLRLANVWYRRV